MTLENSLHWLDWPISELPKSASLSVYQSVLEFKNTVQTCEKVEELQKLSFGHSLLFCSDLLAALGQSSAHTFVK